MNVNIIVLLLSANRSIPHLFLFMLVYAMTIKRTTQQDDKVDSDSDAISILDDDWGVDASHII